MGKIPIRPPTTGPTSPSSADDYDAPDGEYRWEVPSFSKKGLAYTVSLEPMDRDGLPWRCNCPAWHERRRPICKHIERMQDACKDLLLKVLTDGYLTKEQVELLDVERVLALPPDSDASASRKGLPGFAGRSGRRSTGSFPFF